MQFNISEFAEYVCWVDWHLLSILTESWKILKLSAFSNSRDLCWKHLFKTKEPVKYYSPRTQNNTTKDHHRRLKSTTSPTPNKSPQFTKSHTALIQAIKTSNRKRRESKQHPVFVQSRTFINHRVRHFRWQLPDHNDIFAVRIKKNQRSHLENGKNLLEVFDGH